MAFLAHYDGYAEVLVSRQVCLVEVERLGEELDSSVLSTEDDVDRFVVGEFGISFIAVVGLQVVRGGIIRIHPVRQGGFVFFVPERVEFAPAFASGELVGHEGDARAEPVAARVLDRPSPGFEPVEAFDRPRYARVPTT